MHSSTKTSKSSVLSRIIRGRSTFARNSKDSLILTFDSSRSFSNNTEQTHEISLHNPTPSTIYITHTMFFTSSATTAETSTMTPEEDKFSAEDESGSKKAISDHPNVFEVAEFAFSCFLVSCGALFLPYTIARLIIDSARHRYASPCHQLAPTSLHHKKRKTPS